MAGKVSQRVCCPGKQVKKMFQGGRNELCGVLLTGQIRQLRTCWRTEGMKGAHRTEKAS